MAQPAQIKGLGPSGEWIAIDNAAAPTFPVLSASTHLGYDTMTGAVGQCINSFGDTGTVLLDPANDTASVNFKDATFNGNPVSAKAFSYTTLTKVLTNPQSATIVFKNPAAILLALTLLRHLI